MTTVLLLGAGGQLGKLVEQSAPDSVSLHACTSKQLDITDTTELSRVITSLKPDLIINSAAYTQVDLAETEQAKAYAVNADAVKQLAVLANPGTRIIHLSTDFVFSDPNSKPYTPGDNPHPVSVYGKSKLQGEAALLKERPDSSIVLRTSWLYSAESKNFVTVMLDLMSAKEVLNVVNDQFGSPTAADTLANIIWELSSNENARGVFHWSDRGVISWYDFALEIQKQGLALGLFEKEIPVHAIPTSKYPTPAKRPAYSALDASSTEMLLGVETLPWQEQLLRVLKRIQELKATNE